MTSPKKRFGAIAAFLTLLGTFPLINAAGNPRLASVRGVDMMQLASIGFCFGAAFMALMVWVNLRRQ
jgi:hypothetical protein